MACYSHNYRERLGGFQNWVEQLVNIKDHTDYRHRVSDSENISIWQHLAIGAQIRCDRCMAVCPAGEVAIGEYLDDRKDTPRGPYDEKPPIEKRITEGRFTPRDPGTPGGHEPGIKVTV